MNNEGNGDGTAVLNTTIDNAISTTKYKNSPAWKLLWHHQLKECKSLAIKSKSVCTLKLVLQYILTSTKIFQRGSLFWSAIETTGTCQAIQCLQYCRLYICRYTAWGGVSFPVHFQKFFAKVKRPQKWRGWYPIVWLALVYGITAILLPILCAGVLSYLDVLWAWVTESWGITKVCIDLDVSVGPSAAGGSPSIGKGPGPHQSKNSRQ